MILRVLTGLAAVAMVFSGLQHASAQYYPPPPGAYGGAYTPPDNPYGGVYLPQRDPAPLSPQDDVASPATSGTRARSVDSRVGGQIESEPLPDPRNTGAPSQAVPPYPAEPVTNYPPSGYGRPPADNRAVVNTAPAPVASPPRSWDEQQAMRPPVDINPPAASAAPPTGAAPVTSAAPATRALSGAPATVAALPPEDQPETGDPKELPPRLQKQLVDYHTREPAGTIVIDTAHTYLYLVLGKGKALRYGIGVGREGFTWSGTERISRMSEWPDWHPPKEMIERQPYLPRFMAGGASNPLGARALYLGKTLYRIHGTNQPSTIGSFVSSGCIRLVNEDVEDLYSRVQVGTRVVVLPGANQSPVSTAGAATTVR